MYPFPYFRDFTWGTPVIPDIYWNAYSYEERIKNLCMELAKLEAYDDSLVDTVNEQYEIVNNLQEHLDEKLEEAIKAGEFDDAIKEAVNTWLSSQQVGKTYDDIKDSHFLKGEEQ